MATDRQVREFIQMIAPLAQKAYKDIGKILPSVCIGMGCIESACGTSGIMRRHNAFFGQKVGTGKTATKNWGGKFFTSRTSEEYTVGKHTVIRSAFRAYDTPEQCVKNYYELLNTGLYGAVRGGVDYRTQMAQIKACGYMTSSTEVNSVCKMIEKYNLTQYDGKPAQPQAQSPASYQVGKTYTLQSNLWVRASAGGYAQPWDKLTPAGRSACIKVTGGAIMKAGTAVTCKKVYPIATGAVWMQIPSGWLCARDEKGKVFIK